MGIAIFDAVGLAKENQRRHEQLSFRAPKLERLNEVEFARHDKCRTQIYQFALVPFRDAFARLKNVDLAELAGIEPPVAADKPSVELREVRIEALGVVGSMAGGLTAGAGAGAATFAAVGTFAAASTGTAISSLSGAAATSATLAWLGGGSIAAGGGGVAAGTAVLTGLVAVPALIAVGVFVEWKGRGMLREQREVAAGLDLYEAELGAAEKRSAAVRGRSEQVRGVLRKLQREINRRLPGFVALIDGNDDYASYTVTQREQLAAMVGLVTTTVAVLRTPVIDKDGLVTDLSARMVEDAQHRLTRLAA
ncbi:MAG: hypothetical protein JWQ19_3948 [Subtercola sp.]|nr:hypothetical protein [Subtercola sp.]